MQPLRGVARGTPGPRTGRAPAPCATLGPWWTRRPRARRRPVGGATTPRSSGTSRASAGSRASGRPGSAWWPTCYRRRRPGSSTSAAATVGSPALVLEQRPSVAGAVAVDRSGPMLDRAGRARRRPHASRSASATSSSRRSRRMDRSTWCSPASPCTTSRTRAEAGAVRRGSRSCRARRRVPEPRGRRVRDTAAPRRVPRGHRPHRRRSGRSSGARRGSAHVDPRPVWSTSTACCGAGGASPCSWAKARSRRRPEERRRPGRLGDPASCAERDVRVSWPVWPGRSRSPACTC